jgi:hypothetical protein
MTDPIAIIEATYSLTGRESEWLAQLGVAIQKNAQDDPWLGLEQGLVVRSFEAKSGIVQRAMACFGTDEDAVTREVAELFAPLRDPDATSTRMFRLGFVTTLRSLPAVLRRRGFHEGRICEFEAILERWLRKSNSVDQLWINAQDPSLIGCVFAILMRSPGPLHPRDAHRWGCIAAHVTSAFRIRRQLADTPVTLDGIPTSEAILDPGGGLKHAEPLAQSDLARAALRHAVIGRDRARGSLRRRNPEEAVALWQALIAGRWSLVDHFDTDGRRFVVAHRNDPSAPDVRGLTLRERQVLAYSALRHPLKIIAYELGLSVSTVSTHIARARAKLQSSLGAAVPLRDVNPSSPRIPGDPAVPEPLPSPGRASKA